MAAACLRVRAEWVAWTSNSEHSELNNKMARQRCWAFCTGYTSISTSEIAALLDPEETYLKSAPIDP